MSWGRQLVWVSVALGTPVFAASTQRQFPVRSSIAEATATAGRVRIPAERIAAAFGVVTSTFRTVAHNRHVGGVPNSYHLLGRAMDVARKGGVRHSQIAAALRNAGYVLIESIDEGDHSHFAFGTPVALQAALSKEQAPPGPRILADEHGPLLLDLGPQPQLRARTEPTMRVHIRPRR